MELRKTLLLSLFMHMCVFTAAILLSFNLRAGVSSKTPDRTMVVVRLIDSLNEKRAEEPVRIKRPPHKKTRRHDQVQIIHNVHKKKAITPLPKKTQIAQEVKKQTSKMVDGIVRITSEQALAGDAVDTGTEGLTEEAPGEGPIMEVGGPSSPYINGASHPAETGEPKDRGVAGSAEIIALIRSSIERAKVYPVMARKRGIEGVVYVRFRIDPDGKPVNIRIVRSSGSGILDKGAIKIIKHAGPYPPLDSVIEVPISFRLRDGS